MVFCVPQEIAYGLCVPSAINLSLGLLVLFGLGAHSLGTGPGFNSISPANSISSTP